MQTESQWCILNIASRRQSAGSTVMEVHKGNSL